MHWAAWSALAGCRAAACAEVLVAERTGGRPSGGAPGAALRELAALRRDGRLAAAAPDPALALAAELRARGHRRAAAAGYARSAAGHRRPQDLVRAAQALGAPPAHAEAFAPPRWLAAGPASGGSRGGVRPRAAAGEPEVSVVIATRDRPAFLVQAVASALAQEVALEVLVVDDASSGAAPAFADARVRVHRRARQGGAGRARNDALALARGRWVAFLDDDDLMAPGRLSTHLDHVGQAGFSFCGQLLVDPARRVTGALPAPRAEGLAGRLRAGSLIGGPSAVVARTALVREAGGFREDLFALGDWDLWLRLAVRAPAVALPELLVAYTVHPENMHLRAPERILEDFRRFDALHAVGAPAEQRLLAWLAEDLAAAGRHAGRGAHPAPPGAPDAAPRRPRRAARAGLRRGGPGAAPARSTRRGRGWRPTATRGGHVRRAPAAGLVRAGPRPPPERSPPPAWPPASWRGCVTPPRAARWRSSCSTTASSSATGTPHGSSSRPSGSRRSRRSCAGCGGCSASCPRRASSTPPPDAAADGGSPSPSPSTTSGRPTRPWRCPRCGAPACGRRSSSRGRTSTRRRRSGGRRCST